MNFNLIKSPKPISFSGNTAEYIFAADTYGPAQQAQDIRLQIKVFMESSYNSGVYKELRSEIILPDTNGICRINIASIADAYLKFFIPNINWPAATRCKGQSAKFKISYRIILGDVPFPEVETAPTIILKGGLPYDGLMIHQNWIDANLSDYVVLSTITPFTMQQRGFISVLYKGAGTVTPIIQFLIEHFDNTATPINIPFTETLRPGDIFCIPFKAVANYNLPAFIKDFQKAKLKIAVIDFDETGNLNLNTNWRFKRGPFNNAPFGKNLFFVNSAGGLDSMYAYGNHTSGGEYEQTIIELFAPTSTPYHLPQSMADEATVINTTTANTGFIAKTDEPLVKSLLLNKASFVLEGDEDFKSLLPVIITKKKHNGPASTDFLYDETLEWAEANRQSFYHQLSMGAINDNSCPALLSFNANWQSGKDIRVSWALPAPYDRIVITDSFNVADEFVLEGSTGSALITLDDAATGLITITAKCYCGDAWDGTAWVRSLGPASTADVTIGTNQPPIAIDDTFAVPAGITTLTALVGNVLDNDSDPEGDAIECEPAAGFTLQGGSYTLSAAGKVSYKPLTPGYVGTDQFPYIIREVANFANNASAIVRLLVSQSVVIYARMDRDLGASGGGFGGTNQRATYVLRYFSDASGSVPLNISPYNITINWRQTNKAYNSGGTVISTDVFNYTLAATGTENIVQNNIYWMQWYFGGHTEKVASVQPGTGYTVI